jgi:hypothetical protein
VINPTALASTRRSIRIATRSSQSGTPARLRVFYAKATGHSFQLDGSASGSGASELQSTGRINPHATRNPVGIKPELAVPKGDEFVIEDLSVSERVSLKGV